MALYPNVRLDCMIPEYLCVLYYEMPRREYKRNERCGEEHLNKGDISIIAAEYLRKWIGMVYAEAFRRPYQATCQRSMRYGTRQTNQRQDNYSPD